MRDNDRQKRTVTSWEYIKDNFQPGDRLALVIKNQQKNELVQRIATAEQLAGPRFQAWLRFQNVRGGDIYVSMNPLKQDARGRTKQDVATVRHVYLDLDSGGPQSLAAICDDERLPRPSYVLNTSACKYQVIWKVAGFGTDAAERLQRAMAIEHGADRAATDVTRVLRIPGLCNRKYDPPYQVVAERLSDQTYYPSNFRIDFPPGLHAVKQTLARQTHVYRGQRPVSESERDWAETLQRLERGGEPRCRPVVARE